MQGPAGVRTGETVESDEHWLGDLEPGKLTRPNGIIVGPVGRSFDVLCFLAFKLVGMQISQAPFEIAGPLDRAGSGEAKAEHAAESAVADAHNKSNDPDDVIAALEAAEAKYDQANPDESFGDPSCH